LYLIINSRETRKQNLFNTIRRRNIIFKDKILIFWFNSDCIPKSKGIKRIYEKRESCPSWLSIFLVSVLFQYFLFLLRLDFRSGYGPNLFTTASRRSLLYFRSSFNLLPLHSEKIFYWFILEFWIGYEYKRPLSKDLNIIICSCV